MSHWNIEDLMVPNYAFERQIGAGSSGQVGAFRNEVVTEFLAIKALFPKAEQTELQAIRLIKANLDKNDYQHLVEVGEVGQDRARRSYYKMPLAADLHCGRVDFQVPPGYAPKTLAAHHQAQQGPLPVEEALGIIDQVVQGLRRLHARKLWHCDTKPANIFFIDDHWRVGDFGSVVYEGEGRPLRGTPGFMPPEGVGGDTVDSYGVGKVLFLLTAALDDEEAAWGSMPDPFVAVERGDWPFPESFRDLEPEWRRLLLGACARDRRERFGLKKLQQELSDFRVKLGHKSKRARFTWEDWDLDNLTEEQSRQLELFLRSVHEKFSLLSQSIQRGSVVIELGLTVEQADALLADFKAGAFASFGVTAAQLQPVPTNSGLSQVLRAEVKVPQLQPSAAPPQPLPEPTRTKSQQRKWGTINPEARLSDIKTDWTLVFQDHELLTMSARQASQHRFLEQYAKAVHSYLLGALHDEDAADDLFQEFCLRFLKGGAFQSVTPKRGRFRHYLRSYLRNMVVDHQRRLGKRTQPLNATVPEPALEPQELASDLAFLEGWRQQLLDRAWVALDKTNPRLAAVLRLCTAQPHLSLEEVAEQLSSFLDKPHSLAHVRRLRSQARSRFSDILLQEVICSLEGPSLERLHEELIDLGWFSFLRGALERSRLAD